MVSRVAAIFVAVMMAAFIASPALGQAWVKRNEAVTHLDKQYNEEPVGMGLARNGMVVELFISPEGGWTILLTLPNGMSRSAIIGEAWQPVPRRPSGISYTPIHGDASWIMESDETRSCCGPADCFALPAGSVRFTALGWQLPNGIVWPTGRRDGLWIGRSKDEHFWVCWYDPVEKKSPRCLFTPRIDA